MAERGHARRGGLAVALAAALWLGGLGAAHAQFIATRIWPAHDYTRVTFESRRVLDYSMFALKDPDRLVIDLSADDPDGILASLQQKVAENDPYVASLRVAANRPGVTRVVLDLKTEVRPQLFALKPVKDYGNRLVLDLYPLAPPDPLAALLELNGQIGDKPAPAEPGKPAMARIATIVVDAGHGGEDPGARGRRGTREKDKIVHLKNWLRL